MSWNLNSLAKDNFQCTRFIEAHSALFNYDLISICETSLNDSVELPGTLMNDYTFVSANIQQTLDMVGLDFSLKIFFLLKFETICLLTNL